MASRKGQIVDGILLLDKQEGFSSNQTLQRAKRILNARKAGHTGTLDPFATGLLVCCLGKATKLAESILASDKAYEATLRLGIETDSGDLTGEVTAHGDYSNISKEKFLSVLPQFSGLIEQVPPMHSALKKDGRPLYEYARQGIEIKREPRQVNIHKLELMDFTSETVKIFVLCSKGTYVRTLAQDIGRALGCGAHLIALRRTEVGPYSVKDAVSTDTLKESPSPLDYVLPVEGL